MVFYFSGTGNSKYAAQRIAEALDEPLLSLNERIKAGDTTPVKVGARLVVVTPTYAWRIPRVVREHLRKTALPGAEPNACSPSRAPTIVQRAPSLFSKRSSNPGSAMSSFPSACAGEMPSSG